MIPGKSLEFAAHAWRGIGPDVEPDLFFWRYRFGFVTVTVAKVPLLAAYHELRDAIATRVAHDRETDIVQRMRDSDGR